MENNEIKTWHLLVFTALCSWMIYMIYYEPEVKYVNINSRCNEDSLRIVIVNLESLLESEYQKWDDREMKYESTIFEYQYGLDRIKETHPDAHREFHRIIGFKEKYSRDVEKENKRRMEMKF